MKRTFLTAAVVAGLLATSSAAAAAPDDANPGVAPPSSRVHGMSYAERAAAWWQWAIALRATGHPLFATGSIDCTAGQSGHVWYLAGAFEGADPRSCAIPSGTALFLPLVNVECSTLEPPPFFGADDAELRACVQQFDFTEVHASVDGDEIGNLDRFLVEWSPLFSIVPPSDNILGVAGGSFGVAVARGVHVLLRPLPVGDHVVTFGGTILLDDDSFTFDVTYRLTVMPRGRFS